MGLMLNLGQDNIFFVFTYLQFTTKVN